MNQNNYNVCGRCGSANPLSARYCYQCGFELKSPEAPVVCTKCNTVNPGSANFCKRCGSKLPKAQAKVICPQCSAANNAESTYCSNCGYDFTTHSMPSTVAVQQQLAQAAATDVVVTKTSPSPKLSRKEQRRLKKQEAEREYREAMEAKQAAKLQKKQEKALKKQRSAEGQQAVVQPMAVPQYQYAQPVGIGMVQPMAQPAPQAPVAGVRPKRRIANLICFIAVIVALYFVLYPAQIAINGIGSYIASYAVNGAAVNMSGWDIIVACVYNFFPGAAFLSDVVSAGGTFNTFDVYVTGVLLVVFVLEMLVYFIAKFVGICTGRRHNGVDAQAIVMCVVSAALAAAVYFGKFTLLNFTAEVFIVPAVFLVIAVFNSGRYYQK